MAQPLATRFPTIAEHLEGARRGEPVAVDCLCAALRPLVETYVQRKMGHVARRWTDAEDIVQSVLLETVAQLPRLPVGSSADELLRRVQRTASLRLSDAARNHGRMVGESVGPGTFTVSDGWPSEGSVTNADRRRWLEELVTRLPEKYAVVVRLCAFEELTCVEAAKRLGLEPDTVRKRYEHARTELERRLRDRDDV